LLTIIESAISMAQIASLLMRQFLYWLFARPRTYAEAMEAWRSSCPRLTVWEDALMDGLIQVERGSTLQQSNVTLTDRGRAVLEAIAVGRPAPENLRSLPS
jgi:hypothetical protein